MHSFYFGILLAGKTTLSVAISALSVGLVLGLLLAVFNYISVLRHITKIWVMLIRGLPEIFILFLCYFGLTALLTKINHHYMNINPYTSGVITLSIIFAAYSSQIFISAYHAIAKEDITAATSLSLSKLQIAYNIILPQIIRHALPGLINLWLVLLKDSSIVSIIGLQDIMHSAHIAATETFQPFNYYLFAGFIYLIFTAISLSIGKKLQQLTSKGYTNA